MPTRQEIDIMRERARCGDTSARKQLSIWGKRGGVASGKARRRARDLKEAREATLLQCAAEADANHHDTLGDDY